MQRCFIELMKSRGMMAQVTHEEELRKHLAEGPKTAYVGFDPTAESLHIGNLLPVIALRRWQQCGHRVVALMGGGTAMVGDPTGKTELRKILTEEIIDQRAQYFKKQLSTFLDFSTPDKGIMVNNADWLRGLNYISFLREYGSQFSVNRMLGAECFKSRLEKGLSFLEFNYMILQSFDFYYLFEKEQCTVQMGGDDQWSNMLGGIDLIRRKHQQQAYCFTVPLLVSSTGKKMGKTEQGAIWVDEKLTSPYDLFQYFRNVEDQVVQKCLLYFSDLPVEDIAALCGPSGDINKAKEILGFEATKLVHSEAHAEKALATARELFLGNSANADAPLYELRSDDFEGEIGILDLLSVAKIAPSRAEARRWVTQGGLSIDGEKISDPTLTVSKDALLGDQGILIRKGKKHYYRLKILG